MSSEPAGPDVVRSVIDATRSLGSLAWLGLLLAVGLGVAAFGFIVARPVLFNPLPFERPTELFHVGIFDPTQPGSTPSGGLTLRDAREVHALVLELGGQASVFATRDVLVDGMGLNATISDGGLLRVLGIPAGGTASNVHVSETLHERLWHRRAIKDGEVLVDNRFTPFAGVLPAWFGFPERQQAWIGLPMEDLPDEGSPYGVVVRMAGETGPLEGRLAAWSAARSEVRQQLRSDPTIAGLEPLWHMFVTVHDRQFLLVILVVAACLMLVSTSGAWVVATLRASSRAHDLAVWGALGASPRHMLLSKLGEGAVCGLVAAGPACLLTTAMVHGLNRLVSVRGEQAPPEWLSFQVDWLPLAATALASTMLASIINVLANRQHLSQATLREQLQLDQTQAPAGFAGFRLRVLMAVQIGLASLLVVVAICLAMALNGAVTTVSSVVPRELSVISVRAGSDAAETGRELVGLAGKIRLVEGDGGMPAISTGQLFGRNVSSLVNIPGRVSDNRMDSATYAKVNAPYFDLLPFEVLNGRVLGVADDQAALTVAVVNAAFARRHFGSTAAALGASFRLWPDEADSPEFIVVGVVTSTFLQTPGAEESPAAYLPFTWSPERRFSILIDRPLRKDYGTILRGLSIDELGSTDVRQTTLGRMTGSVLLASLSGLLAIGCALAAAASTFALLQLVVRRSRRAAWIAYSLGFRGVRLAVFSIGRDVLIVGAALVTGLSAGVAFAYRLGANLPEESIEVSTQSVLLASITLIVLFAAAALPAMFSSMRAARPMA